MKVVGDYCLVEPFEREKVSDIVLTERAEAAQISLVGKVIAIGRGKKIKRKIKIGQIVHRSEHPMNLNLELAGKVYFKLFYPDGIAIIYTQAEYDQLMVDEKEQEATLATRARIVRGL